LVVSAACFVQIFISFSWDALFPPYASCVSFLSVSLPAQRYLILHIPY
jgi:hypothetical protein